MRSDKFHFVKSFFYLLAFNNHHATEPEVESVYHTCNLRRDTVQIRGCSDRIQLADSSEIAIQSRIFNCFHHTRK